jgi:hypothetical protein
VAASSCALLTQRRGEAGEAWGLRGRAVRGGRRSTRRGAWSRPAGDSAGGMTCLHRGGAGVTDTRDPASSRRASEEGGAWADQKNRVGRARMNRKVVDLLN